MDMNWVYILIGMLVFLFGGMIFFGGSKKAPPQTEVAYKDGKPILPRHQRTQNTETADALSVLATVAQSQVDKQAQKQTPIPAQETTQSQESAPHLAPSQESSVVMATDTAPSHLAQPMQSPQTTTSNDNKQESLASTTPTIVQPVIASPASIAEPNAAIYADKSSKEAFLVYDQEIMDLQSFFLPEAYEALRNNDVLYDYKKTVTLVVSPKNSFEGIDGKRILRIAKDYGLKYGQLNLFHRYEDPTGKGLLWFSLLGVNKDGASPFDLNTLADTTYKELAFFLPLPHPEALSGFDSMYQVAEAVAGELGGYLFDEHRNPIDAEYKQALRQFISEYQG